MFPFWRFLQISKPALGEQIICSRFPWRLPPCACTEQLWWLTEQWAASFTCNQQDTERSKKSCWSLIMVTPPQYYKTSLKHWPVNLYMVPVFLELDVPEIEVKANTHWYVVFPPERINNVSIMKTKVSSFLGQFVYCVQACNRDLMPFSGFVWANTIISLAPASWQTGPRGKKKKQLCLSTIYALSQWQKCWHIQQMKSKMSSGGLWSSAIADDTAHYVVPDEC